MGFGVGFGVGAGVGFRHVARDPGESLVLAGAYESSGIVWRAGGELTDPVETRPEDRAAGIDREFYVVEASSISPISGG